MHYQMRHNYLIMTGRGAAEQAGRGRRSNEKYEYGRSVKNYSGIKSGGLG